MISKEDIDRFYAFVKSKQVKKLNAKIVEATNYSKSLVSTYMSGKKEPSEDFIKAVYKMFNESSQKISHETDNLNEGGKNESIDLQNLPGDQITRQILLNISESHKALIGAHKDLTDANKTHAKNEEAILEQMKATAGVVSETIEAVDKKVRGILEMMVRLNTGEGKRWLTDREARAELNSVVHGMDKVE